MTPTLVPGILLSLVLFTLGCKSMDFLPYQSKKKVKKEYYNDLYYDSKTNTEFMKGNWFYFLTKQDLKNARETELYDFLLKTKEALCPIYAGTNKSYENLPEYVFVFKVLNPSQIARLLVNNYPGIKKFLYNTDYNFTLPANRLTNHYYKHDQNKKNIIAFSQLFIPNSNTNYLVAYTAQYRDTVKFLQKFYTWDAPLIPKDPAYTYSHAIMKHGADTVMQLQAFVAIGHIIKTIGIAENKKPYNFFATTDSVFKAINTNSYYSTLSKITELYTDELMLKENNARFQEYYQCKATYLSFAGQHDEAMSCESEYKNIKNTFAIPPGYEVSNAVHDVLSLAKDKQIVAFNEAHHDIRSRAFVFSLLDSLKERGFTHLAIEDLQQLPTGGSLSFTSGFYCREPIYNNLILYANQLGFTLIAYDRHLIGKISAKKREAEAAKNILKKINFKKNEKLVVFCGYGHNAKTKTTLEPTLIDYVMKISSIEPLTIDLAFSRLYYLQDSMINKFYTLRNINNNTIFYNKVGNADISIYPPTLISYFDYDYYYQNKLLPFVKKEIEFTPVSNKKRDDTLMVYLYKTNRNNSLHQNEVPTYIKLIQNDRQQIPVFVLVKGEFDLIIKDSNNNTVFSKQLQFE